jgi:hypothetical protein
LLQSWAWEGRFEPLGQPALECLRVCASVLAAAPSKTERARNVTPVIFLPRNNADHLFDN